LLTSLLFISIRFSSTISVSQLVLLLFNGQLLYHHHPMVMIHFKLKFNQYGLKSTTLKLQFKKYSTY